MGERERGERTAAPRLLRSASTWESWRLSIIWGANGSRVAGAVEGGRYKAMKAMDDVGGVRERDEVVRDAAAGGRGEGARMAAERTMGVPVVLMMMMAEKVGSACGLDLACAGSRPRGEL